MIEDPADFSNFVVRLRYDDGAAVYLNGIEVVRTPPCQPVPLSTPTPPATPQVRVPILTTTSPLHD